MAKCSPEIQSFTIKGKREIGIRGQLPVLVIVFRDSFKFGNIAKSHVEPETSKANFKV